MNKTDKALEIFMNQPEFFGKSNKVFAILFNKLLEEKRYDDVIKIFKKISEDFYNAKGEEAGFRPQVLNLVADALLQKVKLEILI